MQILHSVEQILVIGPYLGLQKSTLSDSKFCGKLRLMTIILMKSLTLDSKSINAEFLY